MEFRYEEKLLEEVLFLCSSGRRPGISPAQRQRFLRERERPYAVLDPEERREAFFRVHLAWFQEWGFDATLRERARAFPLFETKLDVLAFRQARGQSDEGAELYLHPGGSRRGVVALRLQHFQDDRRLLAFLNHELLHLHDLIDPAFAYSPWLEGGTAAPEKLVLERYRLLWDVTVDGRLTARQHETIANREQRWTEFCRAYSFWPEAERARIFQELWNASSPCHSDLLHLAGDPRGVAAAQGPCPGGRCPLCGFPTHDWAEATDLPADRIAAIQTEFPQWRSEHGICRRCFEIYETASRFSWPPALFVGR